MSIIKEHSIESGESGESGNFKANITINDRFTTYSVYHLDAPEVEMAIGNYGEGIFTIYSMDESFWFKSKGELTSFTELIHLVYDYIVEIK